MLVVHAFRTFLECSGNGFYIHFFTIFELYRNPKTDLHLGQLEVLAHQILPLLARHLLPLLRQSKFLVLHLLLLPARGPIPTLPQLKFHALHP